MNYGSSRSSWKPWRWVRLDLILSMRDIYINSNLNPLTNFISSSRSTDFKACVCYFSLFLIDKCISSLVWTKYIEKKFTLQLFFLLTVSRTFILSWATMRYPPWNFLFRKNNCMCNRDNVRDVDAGPDKLSTKRMSQIKYKSR